MTTFPTKGFNFNNLNITQKTKKWQPAEWDTQDLIQTWCVPHSGLASQNKKNTQNEKRKTKKYIYYHNIKSKQKTKKWQPAEWDTQDLIQTWCVPHSRLARQKQKNIQNEKMKIKEYFTKVTLVRNNKFRKIQKNDKTKTKKWQPAEWDTQDLIQTWCVPLSGLARPNKKNKQNEKIENTKECYKVTLVDKDDRSNTMKSVKIKTKKCQPAEWDTQDLIQTWCVPHSGLARQNKKNKLNEKNNKKVSMLLKIQLKGRICREYQSHRKNNKKTKIENGNGRRNALKIVQWNLGSKRWENKLEDIKQLIEDFNPDIVSISEANLHCEVEDYKTVIPGYTAVLPNTMLVMGYCRIVMLVREDINFKLEIDYMDSVSASIWISLPRRGQKKIMVGAIYREQHLLRVGTPNNTDDPSEQERRWKNILEQWKRASIGNECYLVGDINLDHLKWETPEYRHKKMIENTKLVIETEGILPAS